ncbi:hypothetical protein DXU85_23305, partial [Pseudomonas savastanoi]
MPTLTRGAAKAVSTLFFRGKNCGLALGLLGVSAVPDLAQAQGFLKDSHGTLTADSTTIRTPIPPTSG